jgi:hypothetical protein
MCLKQGFGTFGTDGTPYRTTHLPALSRNCLQECVRHRTLSGNEGKPPWSWYKRACKEIRTYVLENRERWIELCALAAEELDSVKLLALTQEIIRLLDEKQQRLKGNIPSIARQ